MRACGTTVWKYVLWLTPGASALGLSACHIKNSARPYTAYMCVGILIRLIPTNVRFCQIASGSDCSHTLSLVTAAVIIVMKPRPLLSRHSSCCSQLLMSHSTQLLMSQLAAATCTARSCTSRRARPCWRPRCPPRSHTACSW